MTNEQFEMSLSSQARNNEKASKQKSWSLFAATFVFDSRDYPLIPWLVVRISQPRLVLTMASELDSLWSAGGQVVEGVPPDSSDIASDRSKRSAASSKAKATCRAKRGKAMILSGSYTSGKNTPESWLVCYLLLLFSKLHINIFWGTTGVKLMGVQSIGSMSVLLMASFKFQAMTMTSII